MEIRARYILMGLFLVAVIGGVFGFVYWLDNTGGFGSRAMYRVRFENSVSGLLTGSAVLFNGIRVGEVTALRIRPDKPKEVDVDIAVEADTPVRSDTVVDLDYQGLTGVAAIALTGGADGAPLVPTGKEPPMLNANRGAGQTLTQSARDTLTKVDNILDENAQPLKELIANLDTFAAALSKNSGKVDGIIAGLERMTGGPKGPDTDKVYDVTAPKTFQTKVELLRGQLAVAAPTALFQLDTQNILFRPSKDAAPLPAGPRWADNLTRMVQARIAQSFENAGFGGSVSQSTDAVTADFQLLIDIRNFQMIVGPSPTAQVEFSAKITDNGKILAAKLFRVSVSAKSADTIPAVAALNEAFGHVATDLVDWTVGELEGKPKAEAPENEPAPKAIETPPSAKPSAHGSGEAPPPEASSAGAASPPASAPAAPAEAPSHEAAPAASAN